MVSSTTAFWLGSDTDGCTPLTLPSANSVGRSSPFTSVTSESMVKARGLLPPTYENSSSAMSPSGVTPSVLKPPMFSVPPSASGSWRSSPDDRSVSDSNSRTLELNAMLSETEPTSELKP
jgi:hypothetical protein